MIILINMYIVFAPATIRALLYPNIRGAQTTTTGIIVENFCAIFTELRYSCCQNEVGRKYGLWLQCFFSD